MAGIDTETEIAVVGAGLIGRAWSLVFARADFPVGLYDADPGQLDAARNWIARTAESLSSFGLAGAPDALSARVTGVSDLAEAVTPAAYVQECAPEDLETKRAIFAELDHLAGADTILASSTSGIGASQFTQNLDGAERCLVAHPVNPPYLVPLVELCPSPATSRTVLDRASALLEAAGQAPVVVEREVRGFLLNRLQGAVLNEALRLYEDGLASAEDIDRTVKYGLGLRWSFMGPFETIDLNAPGGIADYAARYGPLYEDLGREQADPRPWRQATVAGLERERRTYLDAEGLADRQAWRDRRLMALMAHKRERDRTDGQ